MKAAAVAWALQARVTGFKGVGGFYLEILVDYITKIDGRAFILLKLIQVVGACSAREPALLILVLYTVQNHYMVLMRNRTLSQTRSLHSSVHRRPGEPGGRGGAVTAQFLRSLGAVLFPRWEFAKKKQTHLVWAPNNRIPQRRPPKHGIRNLSKQPDRLHHTGRAAGCSAATLQKPWVRMAASSGSLERPRATMHACQKEGGHCSKHLEVSSPQFVVFLGPMRIYVFGLLESQKTTIWSEFRATLEYSSLLFWATWHSRHSRQALGLANNRSNNIDVSYLRLASQYLVHHGHCHLHAILQDQQMKG